MWSQGCCFCRCLHSRPKHCGEEEKERKCYLSKARCRKEEEMLLCKVSDFWSLKVPILTCFKETQLSNPQKYQFDCFLNLRGERRKLRGFG